MMNAQITIKRGLSLFLLVFLASPGNLRAQSGWTVDDCMRYAVEQNYRVRNSRLDTRIADKVAATGLTPYFTDLGNPCFEESRLTLECKTLYVTKMDKDHFVDPALYEKWYSAMAGNPHNVYVAEILNAWER